MYILNDSFKKILFVTVDFKTTMFCISGTPTVGQLQEMARRQQHQIEAQQQLLVAKEQRLKFLRQQDYRHHQMAAEYERLRRLREKVNTST